MKKCRAVPLMISLCVLLSFGSVSYATLVTVDLVQNTELSGWPTPGNYGQGAGTLSYESYATSFTGSFTVNGLTEEAVYQVKLEGQPGTDPTGNANIGFVGRWITPELGPNITDAQASALIASGTPPVGFLLFDSFTAASVPQTFDFYADWSYHTAGVNQRGSIALPDGRYTATFVISNDTSPYGSPLVARNISFEVGASPVPIPSTLFLLGSGLVGLVGIGRRRMKK